MPSLSRRSERSPGASSCTLPNLRTSRNSTPGPRSANSKRRWVCRSGSKRCCSSGASAARRLAESSRTLATPSAKSCPVMPRWSSSRPPPSTSASRYLPTRSSLPSARPSRPRRRRAGGVEEEVGRARGVDARDAPALEQRRDAAARDLDLRQLGHQGSRAGAQRTRAERGRRARAREPALRGCARRRRSRRRGARAARARRASRAHGSRRRAGAGSGAWRALCTSTRPSAVWITRLSGRSSRAASGTRPRKVGPPERREAEGAARAS